MELGPHYTMYLERDGEADVVLRSNVSLVALMAYVAAHDGSHASRFSIEEYDSFRVYRWWVEPRKLGGPPRGPTLSATVNRSHSLADDRRIATEIIGAQFLRHAKSYWGGAVATDHEYEASLKRKEDEKKANDRARSLCSSIINDLVAVGYEFTGSFIQTQREFWCSSDEDHILTHIMTYREAEFRLQAEGMTDWLRFNLNNDAGKIIEGHSAGISWLVEPVIRRLSIGIDENDDDCTFIADDDEFE